jgi:hypothetical protein
MILLKKAHLFKRVRFEFLISPAYLRSGHYPSVGWRELRSILIIIVEVILIIITFAIIGRLRVERAGLGHAFRLDLHWRLRLHHLAVLARDVPEQLVLPVVAIAASRGGVAGVGLVLHVAPLMVVTITDSCEPLWTKLAAVGLLSSVDPDVDLQVAALIELLVAMDLLARLRVNPDHLSTNEVLFFLFGRFLSKILHKSLVVVLPEVAGELPIMLLICDLGKTEVGEVFV